MYVYKYIYIKLSVSNIRKDLFVCLNIKFLFQAMYPVTKHNGMMFPQHPSKIIHQPSQSYLCGFCHKTMSDKSSYECHKRSCKMSKQK